MSSHYKEHHTTLFWCAALSFLLFYNGDLWGQKECVTEQANRLLFENHLELYDSHSKLESDLAVYNISTARDVEVITIPVAVHVLHLGEPLGQGSNISDQKIYDAIERANEQWRNENNIGSDMKVQFCLAQRDPQGNPSTGIVRVDASHVPKYASEGIAHFGDTGGANELTVKNLSNWPHNFVYNIWVVNSIAGGWAGYAYYPLIVDYPIDGAVLWSPYMNGFSNTLTHELGHGFNLIHTFGMDGNFCDPNTNCNGQGDKVCDTAPHKTYDCFSTTCAEEDELFENSYKNYMSYCSGDDRFTQGQVDRVRSSLNSSARRLLKNSKACQPPLATGVLNTSFADQFKIYPNPNSGVFNVSLPSDLTIDGLEILIFDNLGRSYFPTNQFNANNREIQIQTDLTKGIYWLKIKSHAGLNVVKKILVE